MMIKKMFSFRQKYDVRMFLQQFKPLSYFKQTTIDGRKKYAYIFLAADYGNLGDVAITYAQTKFLKNNLDAAFEVLEIPISQSLEGFRFVKKHIKPGDLITTVGGGNLGDMYDQIEYVRQLVVRNFPDNKIISFPQTFDFAPTASGEKALKIAKKTYNQHSDLYFVAREKKSFELMKKHFHKATILLTPDIVISLDKQEPEKTREGVVLCMRKDKERNLSDEQTAFLKKQIRNRFESISCYDTHISRDNLSLVERKNELNKIWNVFRSAELVVTDRLHGMIFCYITNTPCMVFQNNNHKIIESYEWIKENENINLMQEYSEMEIKAFLSENNFHTGALTPMENGYKPLIKTLQQ